MRCNWTVLESKLKIEVLLLKYGPSIFLKLSFISSWNCFRWCHFSWHLCSYLCFSLWLLSSLNSKSQVHYSSKICFLYHFSWNFGDILHFLKLYSVKIFSKMRANIFLSPQTSFMTLFQILKLLIKITCSDCFRNH